MKKKLLTVLNLFAFIVVFGQTGIGTHTPEGALDITSPNKDWGLVLPCVDQAENTTNPTGKNVKKGTVVYDLKENCIRYFNGDKWSGCLATAPIPNPFELNCSAAVLNKDIIANYPITAGTTVSIPYSNTGEILTHKGLTIQSKGITGLTAVLSSGSVNKGAGNLIFTISGTPPAEGEARFSLKLAGVDCEFVIAVKNYTTIEVPAITNLICEQNNQLNGTTLRGKHMINGEEVTVAYISSSSATYTAFSSCNVTTLNNSVWLSDVSSVITITFSRPVTNVGIAFAAGDSGEVFTLTTNGKQPIQLKSSSSCENQISITDNKVNLTGSANIGGNLTVGGVWFTELKLEHNGQGGGSLFGFCLNNSDTL